ncbi:MAG: hypothetical protein QXI16_01270 [Sulfolobaceae archaeon]
MFDTIYQWVITDLIGPSVMLGSFIHPLALVMTAVLWFTLIWFVFYFVKWSIQFVSRLLPWA